jgi:hypothetical protein
MKNEVIGIGITFILIIIYFSGCIEENIRTQEPLDFREQLPLINESLSVSFADINIYIKNYDYYYRWSILINLVLITDSLIIFMQILENNIKNAVTDIENEVDNYYKLKNDANLSQFTDSDIRRINDIEAKILDYNENVDNISFVIDGMARYTEFWNLTRVKQIYLEEYSTIIDLMNQEIQNEELENSLQYPEQLIQSCKKLTNNDEQKNNLNIITYSEDILNIWNIYIEAWELYEEYLNLLVESEYDSAKSKYTEYSQKNNEASEIEATQNLDEFNDQIDYWYQINIEEYLDLFEEYNL